MVTKYTNATDRRPPDATDTTPQDMHKADYYQSTHNKAS